MKVLRFDYTKKDGTKNERIAITVPLSDVYIDITKVSKEERKYIGEEFNILELRMAALVKSLLKDPRIHRNIRNFLCDSMDNIEEIAL